MFREKRNSKKRFLFGLIAGILLTTIFLHYNPIFLGFILGSDSSSSQEFIKSVTGKNQEQRNALIVATTGDIDKAGLAISYDEKSRFIYPSSKQMNIVSVVFSYTDAKSKVRKFLLPKTKAGYYSSLETEMIPPYIEDNQIKLEIEKYLASLLKQDLLYQNLSIDSISLREHFKLNSIALNNDMDFNSTESVLRLIQEKIEYASAITPDMITEISSFEYYDQENQTTVTKISLFLVDLGKYEQEPSISPKSPENEIEQFVWTDASDIEQNLVDKDNINQFLLKGTYLTNYYAPILNKAISFARNKDIANLSRNLIASRTNLIAFLTHFKVENDLKTTHEFGKDASSVYNTGRCMAENLGTSFFISQKYLQSTYDTCKTQNSLK